ncbi:MAG: DegV family protein [Firmicutes bacterium]|nr:DegV family protein [Bacillota bacterium]
MGIIIVTDSTADLPRGVAEELKIAVVPLKVHFGEEAFLDWIDLDADAFFQKLQTSKVIPRTSQPSPADFESLYQQVASIDDSIISLHLSSHLSGTYQSAVIAKSVLEQYDIEVIDTKTASMGLGIVVIEAARAAAAGCGKTEIINLIHKLLKKVKIFFAVDTLEYLQRNGRIGKAAAMVGGLLNVKPILTLEDGIVVPKGKVRGKAKAKEYLIDLIGEEFGENVKGKIMILHGNELESALELKEKIEKRYHCSEIFLSSIGAVIGTHTGPGVLGVGVLPE